MNKHDPVLEDLKNVNESELHDHKHKSHRLVVMLRRKLFWKISTLFVILLFLLYAFYPVIDVVSSRIESRVYVSGVLYFNDYLVHIPLPVFDGMKTFFGGDVERALCLQGRVIGNDYFVDGFYEPQIFSSSFRHVSHSSCENSIIMFHTHPEGRCLASYQDILTLNNAKRVKENAGILIMCEENRFSFYN